MSTASNYKAGNIFDKILYNDKFPIETTYLQLEFLIPDWFESVFFGFTAFRFVLRLTHKQDYKGVCLANKIGILDILRFNQLHIQFPNWMELQEAASPNPVI